MTWLLVIGVFCVGLCGLYGLTLWKARRAEAAYPPVGQFVEVEGVRLYYLRKGKGRPVVLLHGSDGFLQDFEAVFERLAQRYDTLAFDRPGHGYSDAPQGEVMTCEAQARLVRAALTKLGVEKPLLVGHSWSGALLMAYALTTPDEVAGLVLLAGWVYPPDRPLPLLLLAQAPLLGSLLSATVLVLVKWLLVESSLRQAFAPDPVPRAYARKANALWQRWPWQTRIFAQEITASVPVLRRMQPHYASIRVPVVIVTGEEDRVVSPERHALRLYETIHGAERRMLPKTGHEIPLTRPDAIEEAIECAWRQIEARSGVGDAIGASDSGVVGLPRCDTEFLRARQLVFRYGWYATAYQILNPSMSYWFAAAGDAVVGYARRHGVRVVAGAPVCAQERLEEVVAEFEADARKVGERVCYFGATERMRSFLQASPRHAVLNIGAQPVWNPAHWPDILAQRASLRAQINRARNKQVEVAEWSPQQADNSPDVQRCLDEWLALRPFTRLRFLTEPVSLDRLVDRRIFVATRHETPIGFLIATPIPDRNGWLIEQIVRGRHAPNGTAERLVDAAMRALAANGADYVTLGLAPLSRRVLVPTARPLPWLRLALAWIRAHGRRFYDFDGLDAFKAKFRPDAWEPIFAIADEPRFSLSTLYAIAAAFIDGPPLPAIRRALLAAARQEIVWFFQRLRSPKKK